MNLFFAVAAYAFGVISKKPVPSCSSERFTPRFSSVFFCIWIYDPFRVNLCVWYEVGIHFLVCLFVCLWLVCCPSTICWKTILPHWVVLAFLLKINWSQMGGIISSLSVPLSCVFICMSVPPYLDYRSFVICFWNQKMCFNFTLVFQDSVCYSLEILWF